MVQYSDAEASRKVRYGVVVFKQKQDHREKKQHVDESDRSGRAGVLESQACAGELIDGILQLGLRSRLKMRSRELLVEVERE